MFPFDENNWTSGDIEAFFSFYKLMTQTIILEKHYSKCFPEEKGHSTTFLELILNAFDRTCLKRFK